jgi:hypothetical protein
MTKKIQYALLAWFALQGLVSGFFAAQKLEEPTWWLLVSLLGGVLLVAYWYHVDSKQKEFRRPLVLTAGVIFLSVLAIPVYVVWSAKRGCKLRAFTRLIGYFCLLLLVSWCGEAIGHAVG